MARAMSLVVLLAANAASPALAAKGARRLSSITGYVMTDSNIFDAVELWLLDEDAADIKYGHITAWDTSAVTDMSCLFKAEEDNGGQCTYPRFYHAAAASFDEDLSGWDVGNVRKMAGIFVGAEAFDQDLAWCVAADDLDEEQGAFYGSKCASTNCGVAAGQYPAGGGCGATPAPAATYDGTYHTDASLRTAVAAWLAKATAAEAAYGHISTWKTGKVTDMSRCSGKPGAIAPSTKTSARGTPAGGVHGGHVRLRRRRGRVQSTDRRLGRVFRRGHERNVPIRLVVQPRPQRLEPYFREGYEKHI